VGRWRRGGGDPDGLGMGGDGLGDGGTEDRGGGWWQGRSLRRRDRQWMCGWASTPRARRSEGGWDVVVHQMGWLHGDRSADAGGGKFFKISPTSPRLCVAVEIPRGGWWRDFQRVWEGPGVGVRWPGAFHTRSDSTAGEGGRFGSALAAARREGRGKRAACAGRLPECRGQSRGPRRTVARTCATEFFDRHPLPLAFGSALSRMIKIKDRNET
jgi:hypothetical protein